MIGVLVFSILASAAMAWVDGAAFVAPSDSSLRTRAAGWWLVVGTLSFVPLPPQVMLLGGTPLPPKLDVAELGRAFAFPAGFRPGVWWALWLVTSAGAALVGARIWDAGKPGWRPGTSAYDTSPAGRARALLVMCDSLSDAGDIVVRVGVGSKDAEALGPELRALGRRVRSATPNDGSGVYRELVGRGVPVAVAGPVTRFVLEGMRQTA